MNVMNRFYLKNGSQKIGFPLPPRGGNHTKAFVMGSLSKIQDPRGFPTENIEHSHVFPSKIAFANYDAFPNLCNS